MVEPLLLRIEPVSTGGWVLNMGHPRLQLARGHLSAAQVQSLTGSVASLLYPASMVLVRPDMDARFSRQEELAGRALSAALHGSLDMSTALGEARARAAQQGRTLLVLVDAAGEARNLPWELLAWAPDGPGLEAVGLGLVARLASGRLPTPRAGAWARHAWRSDPQDPTVGRLSDEIEASGSRWGMRPHDGPPPEGCRRLLHLIGHGDRPLAGVNLPVGGGALASSTVVHGLGPWADADLAMVAVCEGGAPARVVADGLVDQLTRAGARAVVAPSGRVSSEAAAALNDGLMNALARGLPPVMAVAEGRRAVRALARATPDARWHRWTLHLGDLPILEEAVDQDQVTWASLRWPDLSPEAMALVRDAIALSRATHAGYLGVEHLALALTDRPPGPGLVRLRFQLHSRREQLQAHAASFALGQPQPPTPSPRLLGLAGRLSPGATPADLWRLLDEAPIWPHLLGAPLALKASEGATWDITTLPRNQDDVLRSINTEYIPFEVIGGPEDGRQISLLPSERLGRHGPDGEAEHQLYRSVGASDPRVSRAHLRCAARHVVEPLARTRLVRGGERRTLAAEGERLCLGDTLALSERTLLMVRETGP